LKRLDLPGFALFTPACMMVLLALGWGAVTYAWNSAIIIGLFCGGGAAAILFLAWERRQGDVAMMPLGMLRKRVIYSAAITTTLSQGSLLVITYYLPVWFQVVKYASPTMGGIYYLPSVGFMVGSMLTGDLSTFPSALPTFYFHYHIKNNTDGQCESSIKTRHLHPLLHRRLRPHLNRLRPHQHPAPQLLRRILGRLPNPHWFLAGNDYATASYCYPSYSPQRRTGYWERVLDTAKS
jgi:hypothetical protein